MGHLCGVRGRFPEPGDGTEGEEVRTAPGPLAHRHVCPALLSRSCWLSVRTSSGASSPCTAKSLGRTRALGHTSTSSLPTSAGQVRWSGTRATLRGLFPGLGCSERGRKGSQAAPVPRSPPPARPLAARRPLAVLREEGAAGDSGCVATLCGVTPQGTIESRLCVRTTS